MTPGRRTAAIAAALAAALALPAAAQAHAALLHTVPSASGVVNVPPRQVALTYSEPVEPRFAVISVTDAAGHQQTTGPPRRSPANADTLVVPLRDHLPEGWYLVYWRVISVDGHPVRGAFTFAVGPNPGPAPQFVIPSISETAATPRLITARTIVFVSVMAAIGLFVLRALIARPVVKRVPGASLRAVSIAFGVAAAVALVAIPVYVEIATAEFALRSVFDVGAIVPLLRSSAFGRGYLDLELCFALFVLAAGITILVDRPERAQRSVAELLASTGALGAAGAALLIPGLSGHAGQTSPRSLALTFDWVHLVAGSLWIGGLIGLLVLWGALPAQRRVAGLAVAVPRFSNVALGSVLALVASGIGASLLHFPTLDSLWTTSYGKALVVKIGLLCTALALAQVNLLRTTPRLRAAAARPDLAASASRLLRRLVTGEVAIVGGAILTAAVLTSLPPPAKALATFEKAIAKVGPGKVSHTIERNGYKLQLRVDPNRAAVPNRFAVVVTKNSKPVTGADVTATFVMLDMEMGQQEYRLDETAPGVYSRSAPALVMVGHWGLTFEVQPPGKAPFEVLLVDKASG
jgi:copper transport protein